MTGRYLTDTADWLYDAGLTVIEYEDWTTRARSSGGYADGKPWCVMWHHTASQTTPGNDAAYMCYTSSDRPIANALIARDGTVWLLAAGPTNTNGKGGPLTVSRGTVPADQMNVHAWSLEIANSGTGEVYPVEQINAAFTVSLTMAARLGLNADDAATHYSWAPSRKIDPATATAVEGPWQPGWCTTAGTWELDDLRAELRNRQGGTMTDADLDKIRTIVREELNEATGYGLFDWPDTVRETLEVIRRVFNVVTAPPPDG